MTTMIESDGYAILPDMKRNRITILLPQTARTATNTVAQIVNRKEELTDAEAILILNLVKYILGVRNDDN